MAPIQQLADFVRFAIDQENIRMALHQGSKTQADLAAYMAGYEMGLQDMLAKCELVLADG